MKPMKSDRVTIKFPVLLEREFYKKRLIYHLAPNLSNSGFIALLKVCHCCCRCLYIYFQQYVQFSSCFTFEISPFELCTFSFWAFIYTLKVFSYKDLSVDIHIVTCRGVHVTILTGVSSGDFIYWHFG